MSVLDVRLRMKQSWWLVPVIYVMARMTHIRLINPRTAERIVNFALDRAVKYKIGKGKWNHLRGIEVHIDRPNALVR